MIGRAANLLDGVLFGVTPDIDQNFSAVGKGIIRVDEGPGWTIYDKWLKLVIDTLGVCSKVISRQGEGCR